MALLSCYYFTSNCDPYAKKNIASLSTLLWIDLTYLSNPLSMLVAKETRIPTPELLQKLWSCLQTARMAMKLWIAVTIQLQSIRKLKIHVQRSKKNFQEIGAYLRSTLRDRACQIWNWTKRITQCRLLYSAVRWVESAGALLHLLTNIWVTCKYEEMDTNSL